MSALPVHAVDRLEAQQRIERDFRLHRPLVTHVVVALCDNEHQGIVKVAPALGNGQNARTNLYWGARYGLKSFLRRHEKWQLISTPATSRAEVLDRVVFKTTIHRENSVGDLYIFAEAWDGRYIEKAIARFLSIAAGHASEVVVVDESTSLEVGGAAHLIAFVGHNGLMDFAMSDAPTRLAGAEPNSAIVLACASESYFKSTLKKDIEVFPLLLTRGLMAPEAYTLEAAVRAWFSKGTSSAVHQAAAVAYHRYQKCGINAARRLFVVGK